MFDYFRYGTHVVYEASLFVDCMNLSGYKKTFDNMVNYFRYNLHGTDVFNSTIFIYEHSKLLSNDDFSFEFKPMDITSEDTETLGLSKTAMKFKMKILYEFRAK